VDIVPNIHCPAHPPRVLVTRRNVEKTTLSESDFVEVSLRPYGKGEEVAYYGDAKPSVDAPIQLHLFRRYQNVRYMVHGHVYVEEAPYTAHKIPCGGIEEVEEIAALFPDERAANFAVNLRGHGCLLLANTLTFLQNAKARLIARPFPEP
jgi:hypothetical protein